MRKAAWLVACLCGTVGAAWSATPGPLPPEDDKDLARAIFKELIEIRTTHDVGSTVAAHAIESMRIARTGVTSALACASLMRVWSTPGGS